MALGPPHQTTTENSAPSALEVQPFDTAATQADDDPADDAAASGFDPIRSYLRHIGGVPLLDRDAEIALAREMLEARRQRACEILSSSPGLTWLCTLPAALAEGRTSEEELTIDGPVDPAALTRHRGLRSRLALIVRLVERLGGPDAAARAQPTRLLQLLRRLGLAERHIVRLERQLRQAVADDCVLAGALAVRLARTDAAARRARGARDALIEANQRLVIWLARRHAHHHLQLLDLVQEGNVGLMRAVEKFDHRRGIRFATYATWWIRQAMARAIAEQGRTIRLPVWVHELHGAATQEARRLAQQLGRDPEPAEIAARLSVPVGDIRVLLESALEPRSLDEPLGVDDDRVLGDAIAAPARDEPITLTVRRDTCAALAQALGSLSAREAQVLRLRFGFGEPADHTLEEIGGRLGLTRERIRQIESAALRKLRHPARARTLRPLLSE